MTKQSEKFRTHIPEPRWQQVASILVVLALVALWLYGMFFAGK